ncbi:YqiJ family protein [Erythrobacter sp. JK5]|uniref:YqiJ family protein n=1 Tax=Erythrobacter sp. JK5 TaxID=2829500 RepID=UPI001BAC003F|nr:YqiJ family protein [Erythrobacter sp. JK5]QUL37138.1 YqiJ family protein [Erythrobacter sp. JK5]
MSILEAYNMPFAVALALLAFVAIAQIIGAGDMFGGDADLDLDFDMDADIDADIDGADAISGGGFIAGLLSLIGLGKVPLLVWLTLFLVVYAAIGVSGQALAINLTGGPLHTGLAGVLAAIGTLPVTGIVARPVGALLPKDETSAVGLDSLIRRDAEVQIGTARAGSPARSKVIDRHGHPHFVMVEPNDPNAILAEGETVLLVRREGERFFAVQYENPMLGLE